MSGPPQLDFLIIGAPKCGTTSLCHYLSQHPQVVMSEPKETHFFCDDRLYAQGPQQYRRFFQNKPGAMLIGEATPYYSLVETFPQVLSRVRDWYKSLRLIMMVRHPLDRLESYYSQELHNGWEIPDFARCLRERSHYLDGSRYARAIDAWAGVYGLDNVLILFLEDMRIDWTSSLEAALKFLGLDPIWRPSDARIANERSGHLQDTVGMRWLRRAPGFRQLEQHRHWIPQVIRSQFRRVLRHPVPQRATWDEELRSWATGVLRDDARRLLSLAGRDLDFWAMPD